MHTVFRIGRFLGLLLIISTGLCQGQDPAPANTDGRTPDSPAPGNAGTENPLPASGESLASGFGGRVSAELNRLGAPQPLPLLWDLAVQGGIFMIPIALCSIVVVAFGIERRAALRKSRIMPRRLLQELTFLNRENHGIDPREAWEACRRFPSPLASILQAAILKIGRPQSELEKAVEDAVARESEEMARNIRPINTCVSIGPLLGLLGTVQGMIMAFMVMSTTTTTGAAKGQELAQGIYTALVTTFAGLCVAIPGIIIANLLESRIERLLRGMEEVFNEIVPLFERYEGKWRVVRKSDASGILLKGTSTPADSTVAAKPERTGMEPRERKPAVPIPVKDKG